MLKGQASGFTWSDSWQLSAALLPALNPIDRSLLGRLACRCCSRRCGLHPNRHELYCLAGTLAFTHGRIPPYLALN